MALSKTVHSAQCHSADLFWGSKRIIGPVIRRAHSIDGCDWFSGTLCGEADTAGFLDCSKTV